MNRMIKALAVAAMLGVFPVGLASAQDVSSVPGASVEAVVEACHEGGDAALCEAAVLAYIAALDAAGLEPVTRDDLLADLVVALAAGAPDLPSAVQLRVAAAIRSAAAAAADPDRAALMVAVAETVEAGEDTGTAAIAASPG